jgi:hypothetical protein
MSATGRSLAAGTGYERHPDDFFSTPYWCTRAIMPHLRISPQGYALDPYAGSGAIMDVARERGCRPIGIERDRDRAPTAPGCLIGDAFEIDWPDFDVIVTNPSYSTAQESIMRAFQQQQAHGFDVDIAFLLRINFLGSQKRAEFHKKHPCDIYVLPKRPEFVCAVSCKKKKECGWGETIPFLPTGELLGPRPSYCARCSGKLNSSSSDATEYGWFCWGPGRGNRWFILDI